MGGEPAAERFAELYSLGNLLALLGTFFLAGPKRCGACISSSVRRQLRRMGREKRWIASICFLVSMSLTLLAPWLSLHFDSFQFIWIHFDSFRFTHVISQGSSFAWTVAWSHAGLALARPHTVGRIGLSAATERSLSACPLRFGTRG